MDKIIIIIVIIIMEKNHYYYNNGKIIIIVINIIMEKNYYYSKKTATKKWLLWYVENLNSITSQEDVRTSKYIFAIKYFFISSKICSNTLKIKEWGRNPWSDKNDEDSVKW